MSVTATPGFTAAGIVAGLKASGKRDLAVVIAQRPVTAALVATTNQVKAAPVILNAQHLEATGGRARAVLLNSGCANVCTGEQGMADARDAAALVANELGCAPEEVLLASTGVIGVPMQRDLYLAGIPTVIRRADQTGGPAAAEAIMTTDLVLKQAATRVGGATIGGMVKGSGMIAPGMATMLAVVTTDAALDAESADAILRRSVDATFNRASVDGVMSTNDTVILLASGTALQTPAESEIEGALTEVLANLATQMVRDGEGATHLVHVTVTGAASEEDAVAVGRRVANDNLVKTAIAGCDPNWGRIIAAVGAAPVPIDPARIAITIAGTTVCQHGVAAPFDRGAVAQAMQDSELEIAIDLGLGDANATFTTCDLTHGYITINAEYTT